jgi:outer membrane protein TolC
VSAAVLSQFPKINLGLTTSRDPGNVLLAGAGLSIDLPIFDRGQGAIALEKANRQKLFDEFVNRVFEARSDIALLRADIAALNALVSEAESTVPALEQLAAAYDAALGTGQVDVVSYYATLGNLASHRIAVLRLRQELMELSIALEIAAGEYLVAMPRPVERPSTNGRGTEP